jgi:DUF4097 and DUF4098 domain-containing protein YvlB
VSGPVSLEVLTRSGDVSVRSGPGGTVTVTGKIHVGDHWFSGDRMDAVHTIEKNPPIQQSGNTIHIDYVNERNISIDYEIIVPSETTLRSRTGSGDQTVDGIHGNTNLESGSGDMELSNLQGQLQVHTGSGNVHARDIAGAFTADAGSGDIQLEEKSSGDVRVHTGSGNIEARGVNGGLDLEAGSGDVIAEGAIANGWNIRTGSGDVSLRLPTNAAFDLQAHTSSGTVDVNQPVTMVVQGNLERARRSVEGKVRGGGPTLMVRTGSGDISIR